ncbi:MAG: lipid-A-disaccharide synthase [Burkholderiales bacterium]|nr:lipid-A-disaccharide synthase [Burkholderiales bacterium]
MKIGIVAGEASGDLLGRGLIDALKARWPDAEFVGIAGPRMQAAGATSWYPMEKLAVRGYVEVLKNLRELIGIRRGLKARMLAERPALFIGIDAPDFNLALERSLKAAGIPTIHYVSPSLWAWRPERIHGIKAAVTRMLTIFPFEAGIYEKAGIPVSYVGHPIADAVPMKSQRAEAREQLKLKQDGLYFALLPGSRQTELDYHTDLFIDTIKRLARRYPDARFLVPLATRETRAFFDEARYVRGARDLPIQILFGHSQLALAAADVALVASGTATLEAALLRCPHVITYRMSAVTWRMMKKKALLPYVGLPNILSTQFIVPEILQDDATPENLEQAISNLWQHARAREAMIEVFDDLHASLRQDNPARLRDVFAQWLGPGRALSADAGASGDPAVFRGGPRHDNAARA